MPVLWLIAIVSASFHVFLIKSLRRLKRDYMYFKNERGIEEEYLAWRGFFLRAIIKNCMVFVAIVIIIFVNYTER